MKMKPWKYSGTACSDPVFWYNSYRGNSQHTRNFKEWCVFANDTSCDVNISDIWVIFHEYKDDI